MLQTKTDSFVLCTRVWDSTFEYLSNTHYLLSFKSHKLHNHYAALCVANKYYQSAAISSNPINFLHTFSFSKYVFSYFTCVLFLQNNCLFLRHLFSSHFFFSVSPFLCLSLRHIFFGCAKYNARRYTIAMVTNWD